MIVVDDKQLRRVWNELEELPQEIHKVTGRAISRAGKSGLAEARSIIVKKYTLKNSSKISKRLMYMKKTDRSGVVGASAYIKPQGAELHHYKTNMNTWKSGRNIKASVMKGESMKPLANNAFVLRYGSHQKIVSRNPDGSLHYYRGPSVQALFTNDESTETIIERVSDTLYKRMEHETEWALKKHFGK